MAVPKFITNDMKGGYVGGPTTPARRCYVGGTLVYQGFGPASEQEFIEQEATGGPAEVSKIYGKSIVWRQYVRGTDITKTFEGITTSYNSTTHLVCIHNDSRSELYYSGSTQIVLMPAELDIMRGHKIAAIFSVDDNSIGVTEGGSIHHFGSSIFEYTTNTSIPAYFCLRVGKTYDFINAHPIGSDYYFYLKIIDLTSYYGEGKEPTDIAVVKRDFPEPWYAYDPGSLQSNKTAELRAERVPIINIWDEEWELGGYAFSTGAKATQSDRIRNLNGIAVSPATTYFVKGPARIAVLYYAQDGTYLGYDDNKQNQVFTTPANCVSVNFFCVVTTYNHDICINLSDPAINGQYFPHWRGKLTLNIPTLTGKLNGEGESVVVFPDGLRGVGTDRDAAYGSTGEVARAVVDLGTLDWGYNASGFFLSTSLAGSIKEASSTLTEVSIICEKYPTTYWNNLVDKIIAVGTAGWVRIADSSMGTDPATFKAAMSGVMLDYPLATPQTYLLDTPLPTDLTCEQGDILQRVSDNNCPFVGEMKFGL